MDKLDSYFYKNQDVVFQSPQRKYKGFVHAIENGYVYILLYASFSSKQLAEFDEEGYDIDADIKLINNSKDNTIILQDMKHTYSFKLSVKSATVSANHIIVKTKILKLFSKREGREFLRISTFLQFLYEEINMEDFLDIKDEYVARPSFSTSVYSIYNLSTPKIYQAPGDGDTTPVNPHLERLLIAINSKLDVILSLLNPEASIFADVKEKKVFISGSGIMFSVKDTVSLKQGSIIKITMLFSTVPQFTIKVIAQVVKINRNDENNENDIACKFIAINESDRDEIIKFTLDKQRQQIKNAPHLDPTEIPR